MEINPQQPSSNVEPPVPQDRHEGLWDAVRASKFFPIISIVIIGVIVIGLGFAVAGLLGRFGIGSKLGAVKGPENVEYQLSGEAILKLTVRRAAYYDEYNGGKPLVEGRKFVVVQMVIRNEGDGPAGAYTVDDVRLITPDGSNMKPSGGSEGFFNYGIGANQTKEGEIIFDIDARNASLPLDQFQIAFGKNYGSRATYPLHE